VHDHHGAGGAWDVELEAGDALLYDGTLCHDALGA
jgi:ectoine hydroxylase-related dioxygenase (phytanoyl-CoA dioxygenase family)